MKKIIFTLAFAMMATLGMAQTINIEYGADWKKSNVQEINDMKLVGEYKDYTVATSHRYAAFIHIYVKKECMVLLLDKDMKIAKSLLIEGSGDDEVMAASVNEGKLYLLTLHQEKSKETVNRWVVNLESMAVEGSAQPQFSQSKERKDKTYHWVAQTDDNAVTGLVIITTNKKSDKFEAYQFLFDEEMNKEWQRDYPLNSMSQVLVTEEGEIITLGRSEEKNRTPSKIYASVITEDNAQDVVVTADLIVTDTRLLRYRKGKVLMMGLGLNVSDPKDVRYFGASIDIDKGEMNASYKSMTQLDLNVFNGDNQGRNSDIIDLDAYVMRHCKATDFGGVGTLQVRWSVERCDNKGSCTIQYFQQGVMVFAISDDGEILWHFPIRSDYVENQIPYLMANSLIVEGDDVYFLQTEHAKWPATYDLSKSMKTLKLQGGSKMIGIYHVSADGRMTKTKQEISKKAVLAGTAKKFNNGYLGYLTTGKGVTPVKIKMN